MLGGMAAAICKVAVYRAMAYLSLIHCSRGKSYRNILRRRGVLPRIGGPKASLLFLGRFAEMSGVEYQEKFRKATDRELPFCLGGSESQTESSGTITEVSLTSCDKHADKHRVQQSKEYANGSCIARVTVLPIAIWPSLGPRTQTSGSVSCTAFRLGFGVACAGSG
jgi:hypothetical protein